MVEIKRGLLRVSTVGTLGLPSEFIVGEDDVETYLGSGYSVEEFNVSDRDFSEEMVRLPDGTIVPFRDQISVLRKPSGELKVEGDPKQIDVLFDEMGKLGVEITEERKTKLYKVTKT